MTLEVLLETSFGTFRWMLKSFLFRSAQVDFQNVDKNTATERTVCAFGSRRKRSIVSNRWQKLFGK